MVVEVKRGGRVAYKCTGCGKQIAKGESHFRAGGKDGFKRFHATCVDKAKVVKADKPAKTPKATKLVKTVKTVKAVKPSKNGKSVTVKPKAAKPVIDLDPDTSVDAETDADEAAAEVAALAAAIAGEATEDGPKVAE